MKNNWKKILNELSYRVSSGIPDLTNEQHLMKLWDILKEHNWNVDARVELIKNLSNQEIITEAKTKRTEDLHEAFFALGIVGAEKVPDDYEELVAITQGLYSHTPKLHNLKDHLDVFEKNHNELPMMQDKDKKMYIDAVAIGKRVYQYMNSRKYTVEGATKVFPTKVKAVGDAIVYYKNKEGNSETLDVSLKYQAAQFGSLSIPKICKLLYGKDLQSGILNDMYNGGFKGKIDKVFKRYMDATYDFRKEKSQGKYTKKDRDVLMKMTKKPATWADYKKSVSKEQKTAFSHIYNVKGGVSKGQSSKKSAYLNAKRTTLNSSIDEFLGNKITLDNLEDFITYILRADSLSEDKPYLYAGMGGKKMTFMPSRKEIAGKNYTIKSKVKETKDGASADYTYDVDVFTDGQKLFTFDIKWRFGSGQFVSDLNQKGSKIIFHSAFAKVFGLPNVPPPVKVGK